MRGVTGTILLAALLTGCGGKEEATPAPSQSEVVAPAPIAQSKPDLTACPGAKPVEDLQRTKPLAVPAAFGTLAASDLQRMAVLTATGATLCVDTSWIETIEAGQTLLGGRLIGFDWGGYESGGHLLIDRAGKGMVIDTGAAPVVAPSGKRIAAIEISASGFGSLNAFAVWEILPVGLKEIAHRDEDLPTDAEWRALGWQGESCVKLSYVPSERIPENYADLPKVAGDPWFAAEANKWQPMPGSCPKE